MPRNLSKMSDLRLHSHPLERDHRRALNVNRKKPISNFRSSFDAAASYSLENFFAQPNEDQVQIFQVEQVAIATAWH
jgi:hypothetical protein